MSTKRDSALINDHKREKMNNNDDASIKHETGMEDYFVRNNMLPSILMYLPPRDILHCIETSKKWKEEIDTDYVWNDMLLPSLMLHLPPRDISQCIQASKKWKDNIDTVDIFWNRIVNITVPPTIVDAIEENARKLSSKYTINYEKIALAFELKERKTVEEIITYYSIMVSAPSLDDSRTIHYGTIALTFSWNKTVHVAFLKFLSENGDHVSAEFFELVMIKK